MVTVPTMCLLTILNNGIGGTPGTVGKKHGATVANVAARFIMQQPAVGAVIVGARLGRSSHIAENLRMFDLHLDAADVLLISTAVSALTPVPGDCGDEVSTASRDF